MDSIDNDPPSTAQETARPTAPKRRFTVECTRIREVFECVIVEVEAVDIDEAEDTAAWMEHVNELVFRDAGDPEWSRRLFKATPVADALSPAIDPGQTGAPEATPMTRPAALATFGRLIRAHGWKWTASVPPGAWDELNRCNEVLNEDDRREAIGLPRSHPGRR